MRFEVNVFAQSFCDITVCVYCSYFLDVAYSRRVADRYKVIHDNLRVFVGAYTVISAIYGADCIKDGIDTGVVDILAVIPIVAADHIFKGEISAFARKFNSADLIDSRLGNIDFGDIVD